MNRYVHIAVMLFVLVATTLACSSRPADSELIQGEWTIQSAELAGQVLPLTMFGASNLKLQDGRYEFQSDVGKYVLMPDSSPKAMDVLGTQGPNEGKVIPAIYILDGNTLLICYDLGGTMRPAVFKTQPNTKQFLAQYHRER